MKKLTTICVFLIWLFHFIQLNAQSKKQTLNVIPADNDFKIGMFGGINIKTNPVTGTKYTMPLDNGIKTSCLNVLVEDGFNVVHSYAVPWHWTNTSSNEIQDILTLIDANDPDNMKIMTHAKQYYTPRPGWTSSYCDQDLIVNNEYGCSTPIPYSSPRPNYELFSTTIYNKLPFRRIVWGHQISEEAEYGSSVCTPDVCGCGPCAPDINIETPPLEVSEAINYFRNIKQLGFTGGADDKQEKMIVMPAAHGTFLDDSLQHGACYGPMDYFPLKHRPDIMFEGSYFHRQFATFSDNTEPYFDPNIGGGVYLGKFRSLDYIRNHGYASHAVISSYFGKNVDPIGEYQFTFHTNLNRRNANHLWFNAYNSIVHGATGIWFWGLEYMWQDNDALVDYQDPSTLVNPFYDYSDPNQCIHPTKYILIYLA